MVRLLLSLIILAPQAHAAELAPERITPDDAAITVSISARTRPGVTCGAELTTLRAPGVTLVPTSGGTRLIGDRVTTYEVRFRPGHFRADEPGTPGYDALRRVLAVFDIIWRTGHRPNGNLREDGTSTFSLSFHDEAGRSSYVQPLDPTRPSPLTKRERGALPRAFAEVRLIVEVQRFPRGYRPLGVQAAMLFATHLKAIIMPEDWFEPPAYFTREMEYYEGGDDAFHPVLTEARIRSETVARVEGASQRVQTPRAPHGRSTLRPQLKPRRRPGTY